MTRRSTVRPLVATVLLAGTSLFTARPAHAVVDVVATTSSMGMLARTVGGNAVRITVLSPPDRDAHHLLARPSMMVAMRRANLLLAVGAELEVGWLPAALQGAGNSRIQPGQPGYFEGAAQIDLIETGQSADRSQGDVHPMGNPHFYMDPERMARVAQALAQRLAALDPANAQAFSRNAEAFGREVAERTARWRHQAAGAPGIVFYHKDGNYLAKMLNVPVLGFVEPLPGIPPTASHLKSLVAGLEGRKGVILYNTFHSSDGPNFLSRNLGWPAKRLQLEPAIEATGKDYLDHIEQWVAAVASAKS